MEAEQTQSFNERLSQWIAAQGFWFQLRHSMSGGGGWSMTAFHLVRIGLRVLIAVAVIGAGGLVFLFKRTGSQTFLQQIDRNFTAGIGASESSIYQFRQVQGREANISRLRAVGTDTTFYQNLSAGNIRFHMGLFDGTLLPWSPGSLQAGWMDIDVKAGADSSAQAATLLESFHRSWPGFKFSNVEVDQASVRWGFAPVFADKAAQLESGKGSRPNLKVTGVSRGGIEKSHLNATKSENGWRMEFTGGYFYQNWLRKLEIVKLVVECRRSGIEILEGELKAGAGTVRFENVSISTGERPVVKGKAVLSHMSLAQVLPESLNEFLEGSISGTFDISGSTNSSDGVKFDGRVTLDDKDTITLRDRVPLLDALSVIDVYNSYRRVLFAEGGFRLQTGGGGLTLGEVNLKSGDLMTMRGNLTIRYPSAEEAQGNMGAGGAAMPRDNFLSTQPTGDDSGKTDDDKVSLRNAGKAASADRGFKGGEVDPAAAARTEDELNESLRQRMIATAVNTQIYEGKFTLSIPKDAFTRSEKLMAAYPVTPETGRISLEVPIKGTLHQITVQQAEGLLQDGKHR